MMQPRAGTVRKEYSYGAGRGGPVCPIANDRTRAAYGAGRRGGFLPCLRDGRGLGLRAIPLHVAAYIRTHPGSVPTVEAELGGHPGALRLALRPPGLLQP